MNCITRKNRTPVGLISLAGGCALVLSALFCLGCQPEQKLEASNAEIKVIAEKESPIGKPAASITFTSNYDGISEVGIAEAIVIELTSEVAGRMDVIITAEVLVGAAFNGRYTVVAGEGITIPVTIVLPEAEKHYLNIQTSITTDGQTQTKAFALALNPPSPLQIEKSLSPDQPAIIIMDADETITTQ